MHILRLPEVKKVTGLSTPTIYRLIALEQFPKQIKLGARSVGWVDTDIQSWLESRIANSNAA